MLNSLSNDDTNRRRDDPGTFPRPGTRSRRSPDDSVVLFHLVHTRPSASVSSTPTCFTGHIKPFESLDHCLHTLSCCKKRLRNRLKSRWTKGWRSCRALSFHTFVTPAFPYGPRGTRPRDAS